MRRIEITFGLAAVLALIGSFRFLPAPLAFFLSTLAILLFPGIVGLRFLIRTDTKQYCLPERLVLWFVVGIGILSVAGFAGLLTHLRLGNFVTILTVAYAALTLLLLMKGRKRTLPPAGIEPHPLQKGDTAIYIVLFSVAIGSALLTLATARSYDDWYYLAYIKDYVVGKPLGAEDAIFNMGNPAPVRIWYGGGWWVLESLLSRVSGIDPVSFHQIYLPLLTVPLAVFACFMLCYRIFKSYKLGLFACCAQVLFYLTSAFPYRSAGWVFFCRMTHDKSIACFVVAPVVAALALQLIPAIRKPNCGIPVRLYYLYLIAIVTSALVHGLGPVWCGLFVVPFVLGTWVVKRTAFPTRDTVKLLLPFAVLGLVLIASSGLVRDFIQAPQPEATPVPNLLSSVYFPGNELRPPTETWNPVVWVIRERLVILSPLYVTRYPLAVVGLVLTLALIPRFRSDSAARFLVGSTLLMLLLVYTPAGTAMAAGLMTRRLIFRLTWLLPWGLTIAYFLSRLRLRPMLQWILLGAIALVLARGNPYNYAGSLVKVRSRNRPSQELSAVFKHLASVPSLQGTILASEQTGRMIPAFLPDARPVNFREFGPVSRERLAEIVQKKRVDEDLMKVIRANNVEYILLENKTPLARALRGSESGFELEHDNRYYQTWRVHADPDSGAPATP